MRNLIRICIVLFLISMASESYAQTFGVRGGLNFSNMLMKDNDGKYSEDFKMKFGFHVGGTAELPINDMFSVEGDLLLSTKGTRLKEEETMMGESVEYKAKLNLYYIDVPITAKAYFDVGDVKIYGAAGPYFGVGLAGKTKTEVTHDGETDKDDEKVCWGSDEDEDDFKRFDFGLTFGAGVTIDAVDVGISYALGLANMSPYKDNGTKVNNRVLGITCGYRIWSK